VFTATGVGADAGFCAEAETLQFNTGDWTDLTDAAASGGHTLQANTFGSQIAASLGFASATYYGWIVGRCTEGDRCAVWVQHIDLLPRTPSNTLATKFPLGGEVAVTPIGARTDEDLRRALTPSDTVQRSFAITEDQALYIQAQPGVQLDYVFFSTNANATPSCDDAPAQTVNLVIYHADTLPTPDGTLDTIWTNAAMVNYAGYGSATAAWDTRALYKQDASPRRICLLHQGTLANAEFPTTTEDSSAIFNSDTALRFDFREDVGTVRPLSYSTATNGNATPTTRDGQFNEADAFSSTLDFANRSSGRSYAANLLRIETCFDLPTALVAGQTFRCDLRAQEKVTGSAFTSKRAYSTDDTLATAGICQLSTTTVAAPPADSTPPSMGAVSFVNVTSSGFTATSTVTEAESTVSACQVQYDTDNDNAVSGGDASALISCGLPQGGSCVCPVTGLSASTAYEVVVKATNSAGLTGTSAVGDQTTAAPSGDTFYIAASGGSDSNACTTGSRCATIAGVMAKAGFGPGDTILIGNGTYTNYPNILCSANPSKFNGTASAKITVRAENARQAHFSGTGAQSVFRLENCAHWNIENLRISNADLNDPGAGTNLGIRNSTNITVRGNLIYKNNRYANVQLMMVRDGSSGVLVENNEFYNFHRKAIQIYISANNTIRGNYFNSMGVGNISGGYTSQVSEAVSTYPGANNLVESNISEMTTGTFASAGFTVDATQNSNNNRFFGNIAINPDYGSFIVTRGNSVTQMPLNTWTKDFVVVGSKVYGVDLRSARNSASFPSCEQCSIFPSASSNTGIISRVTGNLGDGNYQFFGLNTLIRGAGAGYGLRLIDQDVINVQNFGISNVATAFDPAASHADITGELTSNPNMGGCYTMVPAGSPYKGAGIGGADIGADAMYRYVDGIKTSLPMFLSGSDYLFYGCGATVAGVNDSAASSCIGVHQRLNLHAAAGTRCIPPY
jgi:parallel beta-helix repeat protein